MNITRFAGLILLAATITGCSGKKAEPSNAMKIYELSVGGVTSVTTSYYSATEQDGNVIKSDTIPYHQYIVEFDEQGRMTKDGDSDYTYTEEGVFDKGVPYTEFLDGMQTILEFNDQNQIIKKITQSPDGLYCTQASEQEYIYDSLTGIPAEDNWQGGEYSLSIKNVIEEVDGTMLIVETIEAGAGYDEITTTTTDYEYLEFDKHGNWTKRASISTYTTEGINYNTNESFPVDDPEGKIPQYVIAEREIIY